LPEQNELQDSTNNGFCFLSNLSGGGCNYLCTLSRPPKLESQHPTVSLLYLWLRAITNPLSPLMIKKCRLYTDLKHIIDNRGIQ